MNKEEERLLEKKSVITFKSILRGLIIFGILLVCAIIMVLTIPEDWFWIIMIILLLIEIVLGVFLIIFKFRIKRKRKLNHLI